MAEQVEAEPDIVDPGSGDEDVSAAAAPVKYPLEVVYCEICTMPPEVRIMSHVCIFFICHNHKTFDLRRHQKIITNLTTLAKKRMFNLYCAYGKQSQMSHIQRFVLNRSFTI